MLSHNIVSYLIIVNLDAPQITIVPQSPYIISIGNPWPGILYCKANGNPIPIVQWYKGNIAVNPIASPLQNYLLVPTNAPHTTVYTCKGTNKFIILAVPRFGYGKILHFKKKFIHFLWQATIIITASYDIHIAILAMNKL